MVSLISLALTSADLIPTKIESLGIEVSPANRDALIALLGVTLLYFLVAFAVYASAALLSMMAEVLRLEGPLQLIACSYSESPLAAISVLGFGTFS